MSTRLDNGDEFFVTPEDKQIEKIVAELIGYAGGANPMARFMVYAFVQQDINDSLIAALARNVDVRGIIDHSQSTTPTAVTMLNKFRQDFPHDRLLIGTSDISDQIIHSKAFWINFGNNVLPPNTFTNWRDSAKNGYPVCLTGSWNVSNSADKQVNTVLVSHQQPMVAALDRNYERIAQWNVIHHADWNSPGHILLVEPQQYLGEV